MEHTNLILFENEAAMNTAYPGGSVDDPIPGVAYARPGQGEEDGTVLYNRMVVNYEITIFSENKSGETVASAYTVETPKVLNGNPVRMNVVAEEVEGYKPRHAVEKVTFTSASTSHTIVYLAATSYTVTVNHVDASGVSIACATTIEVDDVYEEDVVRVKIEPISIPGYTAETVYIYVSGDTTYDLEYEENTCYVDLGLPSGTLWACANLGAASPEQYGNYYAWGEIVPNKATAYTMDNYRFYDSVNDEITKYTNSDGKTELELEDDAANVTLGGEWHIPTSGQCSELLNYCATAWTTLNGTSGIQFTSMENGNSIFFPGAGGIGQNGPMVQGQLGVIWASSASIGVMRGGEYEAYFLIGSNEGCQIGAESGTRIFGFPVRGVIGNDPEPGPEQPVL